MSSTHHSVSQPRQRSQSTPNVGTLRTEQRPRRTKTSIDFFAAPPQNPTHQETRVDPFNLAGFFPSGIRKSDQEPFGWWRDDDLVDESEELASELAMLHGDSGSLSSQHVLFSREDNPGEAVTKGEDKLGALTILTGGRPGWVDGPEEECLHSPYVNDEACDDEALRLAYERRRRQQLIGGSEQLLERTDSLFYEREEEEEGAGWFGLMMMRI